MSGEIQTISVGTEVEPTRLQNSYSWQVAFIYVFNLVVGVGALALPKAFAQTGWILGLIALGVLGLMSYCTSTFMIEAMSIANAVLHCKLKKEKECADTQLSDNSTEDADDSDDDNVKQDECNSILKPLDNIAEDNDALYVIDTKVEMGEMAKMFFNKVALILYYIIISLYLYGDLAIYAAAVPKSMTTVICGATDVFDHDVNLPCNNVKDTMKNISILDMYRIMLVVFTAILCPFIFLNISKTKLLQISTSIFRWIAFMAMIILALIKIKNVESTHHINMFKISSLPNFFGVAVYSFMCQHSLPSILTPVTNKKRLNVLILLDFILIALFYTMVVLTAVFAFPENKIEDLYTLNFSTPSFLRYLLELFPVFTLSTSFPIIGITLRENLKCLFLKGEESQYGLFRRRYLFPLMTVIPPITIAYITYDIGMLVNFTGMYAGAVIQYVIPVMLVYYGRIYMKNTLGTYVNTQQRSPFDHVFWIYFVIGWYVVCFIFVTVYLINSIKV